MLRRFINRIDFLLKSSNQHGVHSPFVYRYLTQGIYDTKKNYKSLTKQNRLLQATIDYFQIQKEIGVLPYSTSTVKNTFKKPGYTTYKYIFYISNIEQLNERELKKLIEEANQETLIYIDSPYKSDLAIQRWKKLCAEKEFHISLDFYFAGILATRKEQEKEHFILRM